MDETWNNQLTNKDLSEVLAVIATEPDYNGSMIDFVAGTGAIKRKEFDRLLQEFEHQIHQLAPTGLIEPEAEIQREYYQIGPASQGPMVEILKLAQDVNVVIQSGVSYLELGLYALGLGRWWQSRTSTSEAATRQAPSLVFTESFIEGLCVADVMQRHNESHLRGVAAHGREVYFGSPSHPSGRECYSVIVSVTKSRHYVYSVSGTGIVQDHFKIVDGDTTALDIPIWFIDDKPELSKLPKSQHYSELG